jgi:protein TonB
MKQGPLIFILAVAASILLHMIVMVFLIKNTKKNPQFYQQKVTLTLLSSSTPPVEPTSKAPKPLSRPIHSSPSIQPNQWRSLTKHPTLVDPEIRIAPIPPSSHKQALVHREKIIPASAFQPQLPGSTPVPESMTAIKQAGKPNTHRPMEPGTHIAISPPPTGPTIRQTYNYLWHEHLGNPPTSSPLTYLDHSSSTEPTINQSRLSSANPPQSVIQILPIGRNESVAGYKLEALGNQPPAYPRTARKQGLEGRVVLSVMVTSTGSPKHISVFESSGAEILDDAAVSAIAKWSFVPAKIKDKSVNSYLLIPIRFRLED